MNDALKELKDKLKTMKRYRDRWGLTRNLDP